MNLDEKIQQELTNVVKTTSNALEIINNAVETINNAEKEIGMLLDDSYPTDEFPAEKLLIKLSLALSKLEAQRVIAKELAEREISQAVLNIKKATPKITLTEAQNMAKLQFDSTISLKIEVSIVRAKRLKSLLIDLIEHLGY